MVVPQLNPEIRLGDVLTVIGFAFAILSLFYLRSQVRASVRQAEDRAAAESARFLVDFMNHYFADQEVRALYHALDYKQVRNAAELVERHDEAISRFLYTMDGIGHLVDERVLKLADVDVVSMQILRVLIDSEVVKEYLVWL